MTVTRHIEGKRLSGEQRIAYELLEMVVRLGIRRDSKKTMITKKYKGQETANSHDHPRPEWSRPTDDEEFTFVFFRNSGKQFRFVIYVSLLFIL